MPILLLHGFTGSPEAWGMELVESLRRRDRVISPALPGHLGAPLLGARSLGTRPAVSHPPPTGDGGGMEAVVDHLVRILDREGIDRADWIGYSMGGRIALAATVLAPERVRALVLEGASPGIADPSARERRRVEDEQLADRIVQIGVERFVDEWMDRPLFRTQRRLSAEVRARARSLRLRHRAEGLAGALRSFGTGAQPSFWGRLEDVVAPVLLLTGSEDPRFTEIAREMVLQLPAAEHRVIGGAGHAVHLEAPDAWHREVRSFLDVPGGARRQ